MTIINLAPLLAVGISLVTNFRQLVNRLSEVWAPGAGEPLVNLSYSRVKGDDFVLPAKPDTCSQEAYSSPAVGASSRLIASTGAYGSLGSPKTMAVTVQASTLMDRPSGERGVGAVTSTSVYPKPSITVQRLSCMTPSPPRFIHWISARGGGRFRPIDVCRPGWQRLAVQYAEGCDITDNGLNLVSRRTRIKHTFDSDFAPEQLMEFERLVAKRIRAGRLDSMQPLKQAVHNSLARVVDLKAARREHTGTSKRSRNHTRSISNAGSFKLDDGLRLRRTRPTIRPLDLNATRASHPPTDSPPESPGPTTPVDGSLLRPAGLEVCIAGDETVPGEPTQKGAICRTPSKGRSMARSQRRG
ncbi:hypothetical protein FRC06_000567 [Ceratobasidium sp. 370]|nr:hypothetical protein FRC06_000567 [Ceratobasidium sp. 370]